MPGTAAAIRAAVGQCFARVARSPGQETKFPVGPASAKKLDYDPQEIDALPPSVTESFCGVGNPLGLGEVRPGRAGLDLGSGPGLDSLLAARRVGPTGKVVGVDLCPAIVEKARRNASLLGLNNAEFLHAGIEKLPLSDGAVDVAISNGVFNLCPDKPGVPAEAFRVLRPGGRPRMAATLPHDDVRPEEVAHEGEWSDGIAGAVRGRSLLRMLAGAGFVEARTHGRTGCDTPSRTEGALVSAREPGCWVQTRTHLASSYFRSLNLEPFQQRGHKCSLDLCFSCLPAYYLAHPSPRQGTPTKSRAKTVRRPSPTRFVSAATNLGTASLPSILKRNRSCT
jgi:protein-L-isoaspartate O-methyltransferase